MVVVAPHPDDETLGAGGLIAMHRSRQIPVELIAVTDGEAAYPDTPDLGARRKAEQARAAEALGLTAECVVRLGIPDSAVSESESAVAEKIEATVDSNTLLVAPWSGDPHPDHEACGRAAERAARKTGAVLISYFFWTWHRSSAHQLMGLPLRRLMLSAEANARRAAALSCHRSQTDREGATPALPENLLAPAKRRFETFMVYGW